MLTCLCITIPRYFNLSILFMCNLFISRLIFVYVLELKCSILVLLIFIVILLYIDYYCDCVVNCYLIANF